MPRIAPFRKTFSRPVSSGWKPVPTSSRLPTRPRISARPSVGVVIRVRILSSVDFPAPLRPMTPERLALLELERDVAQRPDLLVAARCSCPVSRFAAWDIDSRSVP